MKNHISRAFWFTFFIILFLGALHYLPSLSIEGHTLRKVNILSDILKEEPEVALIDTLELPPPVKPAFVDTCKTGMTCIEDYADSTHRGMENFYKALSEIQTMKRPVRIAYFGDSFIEADILTGDLRAMLQTHFGGSGVGYIDITSQTYGFRPTVKHSFSGWSSHAITDSTYFDRSKQGISCHYFIPHNQAYVEAKGQTTYASHLDTCETSTIYFETDGEVLLRSTVNGRDSQDYYFDGEEGLQKAEVSGRIGKVRWTVDHADSTLFYGIAMESRKGISLDNFGLRSSSGLTLRSIPMNRLKQFNRLRPYDLIILQYGLNVATQKGYNYDSYQQGLLSTIEHLKKAFPDAGFLLIGVGDRAYKTEDGDMKTMPGIKNLIRYQQYIAAKAGIAFWNLYEAMGGEGSIEKMVHATPPQANLDYTHINFKGGKHLAKILYETLLYDKEQYDKRRAYEQE